jgi:pSer/pThr/pTyr-binding forkhead associated (FHA) protein
VFSIVISEKGGAERREAFQQSELSIGRVQGNDLMLAKGNVSKRHARLVFRDGRFIVTDLNSTNGTYVNRRRINQATIVSQGDRIYIGDFVIRLEVPSEDSSTLDRASIKPSGGREPLVTAADISQVSLSPARDPLDSTGRYPSVPPAPRMPTGANVDAVPSSGNARSSDRSSSPGKEDSVSSESSTYRHAVSVVVERVTSRLDASLLDREITDSTTAAVERAIEADLETLRGDGIVGPVVIDDRLKRDVAAELLALGPVGPLLEDESVSEIAIAGTHSVVVVRNGQSSGVEPALSYRNSMVPALV